MSTDDLKKCVAVYVFVIVLSMTYGVNANCMDISLCCAGRNNTCHSDSGPVRCYCDEFCTKSSDCCSDHENYCRKQDCVLTYWSHWNECSKRCGKGRQERRREIHIPPSSGGHPCEARTQTRTCYDTGTHCQRKEVALLLPTYYKSYRSRSPKYTEDKKPKRPSYCIRYYLTYVSQYCRYNTPWHMMNAKDLICVECEDTAMNSDGLCRGADAKSTGSWRGIATHNCYGTWKAENGVEENCECGHKHGYDFIFV